MVTEAQCNSCGETNAAGTAFCVLCGAYLGWDVEGRGPGSGDRRPSTPEATEYPEAAAPPPDARTAEIPVHPAAPQVSGEPTPTRVEAGAPRGQEPRDAPPAPTAPGAPAGPGCPACGQPNDPARRFCGRCGLLLAGQQAPAPGGLLSESPAPRRRWWGPSPEREARRAYRRSLPAFYRWRRVVLGGVGIAVAGGLVAFLANDPEWVGDRWHALFGKTVAVEDVTARAAPPGSDSVGAAENIVDDDPSKLWGTIWRVEAPEVACGERQRSASVVLAWPDPVRVRSLQIDPGLATKTGRRDLEFRPESVDVSFRAPESRGPATCVRLTLQDEADRQTFDLDTEVEVRRLRLSVASVFDANNPEDDDRVAIRRVIVGKRS